jgi:phosphonoacetaldehyde hydrolase
MKLQAAVLDWAGTVIDFGSRAPVLAMEEVFCAEGLPIGEDVIRRFMGMAKREHVTAILSEPETVSRWRTAKGSTWSEHDVDRMMTALEPAMAAAASRCAVLIPGAVEAVGALRARGLGIGSTTGYTRTMMSAIVERARAQGYAPDTIVCAGETHQGRPAPLMVWKALVDLGVWPAAAPLVADDAPVGIEAGRHAGCWCVGLAGSGNGLGLDEGTFTQLSQDERKRRMAPAIASLTAAGADFVIATLSDLPDVVAEIDVRLAAGGKPGERIATVWM